MCLGLEHAAKDDTMRQTRARHTCNRAKSKRNPSEIELKRASRQIRTRDASRAIDTSRPMVQTCTV
jgi:hypothetical protein